MAEFDYCITGAGCAGLSLAVRLLAEPALQHKKLLIVDQSLKAANDRTWCFWEKEAGFFEEIVTHRWNSCWFHGAGQSRLLPTEEYSYKMIRGIDFYNYCLDRIRRFPNVRFLQGDVDYLHSDEESTYAVIDGCRYTSRTIFNSIPFAMAERRSRDWHLLQHFKGWVIQTVDPVFDPGKATLMDYRLSQHLGSAFAYILPFSPTRALVECTFFSEKTMDEDQYNVLLIDYISRTLKIRDYIILEKELGIIPMTTRVFHQQEHQIRNIGAAAGMTKPSTGYTFQNIQEDSARIVEALVGGGKLPQSLPEKRFQFYDRILLNVLATGKLTGEQVFAPLFINNPLPEIFAFLDNSSTPAQDWRIIRSLPVWPFARAAIGELSHQHAF